MIRGINSRSGVAEYLEQFGVQEYHLEDYMLSSTSLFQTPTASHPTAAAPSQPPSAQAPHHGTEERQREDEDSEALLDLWSRSASVKRYQHVYKDKNTPHNSCNSAPSSTNATQSQMSSSTHPFSPPSHSCNATTVHGSFQPFAELRCSEQETATTATTATTTATTTAEHLSYDKRQSDDRDYNNKNTDRCGNGDNRNVGRVEGNGGCLGENVGYYKDNSWTNMDNIQGQTYLSEKQTYLGEGQTYLGDGQTDLTCNIIESHEPVYENLASFRKGQRDVLMHEQNKENESNRVHAFEEQTCTNVYNRDGKSAPHSKMVSGHHRHHHHRNNMPSSSSSSSTKQQQRSSRFRLLRGSKKTAAADTPEVIDAYSMSGSSHVTSMTMVQGRSRDDADDADDDDEPIRAVVEQMKQAGMAAATAVAQTKKQYQNVGGVRATGGGGGNTGVWVDGSNNIGNRTKLGLGKNSAFDSSNKSIGSNEVIRNTGVELSSSAPDNNYKLRVQGTQGATITATKTPAAAAAVKPDIIRENIVTSCDDQDPLLDAAKSSNCIATLKHLCQQSGNQVYKRRNSMGATCLHIAVDNSNMAAVRYLSRLFPPLTGVENKAKLSPPALAIKRGETEILRWFLLYDKTLTEQLHRNPAKFVHAAAKYGQDDCMRLLLDSLMKGKGILPDLTDAGSRNSPAHAAAKHGHLQCLQTLVEYGVDVCQPNCHGYDPCYYADFGNHRACAGYLCLLKTALTVILELLTAPSTMTATHGQSSGSAWKLLGPRLVSACQELVVFRTNRSGVESSSESSNMQKEFDDKDENAQPACDRPYTDISSDLYNEKDQIGTETFIESTNLPDLDNSTTIESQTALTSFPPSQSYDYDSHHLRSESQSHVNNARNSQSYSVEEAHDLQKSHDPLENKSHDHMQESHDPLQKGHDHTQQKSHDNTQKSHDHTSQSHDHQHKSHDNTQQKSHDNTQQKSHDHLQQKSHDQRQLPADKSSSDTSLESMDAYGATKLSNKGQRGDLDTSSDTSLESPEHPPNTDNEFPRDEARPNQQGDTFNTFNHHTSMVQSINVNTHNLDGRKLLGPVDSSSCPTLNNIHSSQPSVATNSALPSIQIDMSKPDIACVSNVENSPCVDDKTRMAQSKETAIRKKDDETNDTEISEVEYYEREDQRSHGDDNKQIVNTAHSTNVPDINQSREYFISNVSARSHNFDAIEIMQKKEQNDEDNFSVSSNTSSHNKWLENILGVHLPPRGTPTPTDFSRATTPLRSHPTEEKLASQPVTSQNWTSLPYNGFSSGIVKETDIDADLHVPLLQARMLATSQKKNISPTILENSQILLDHLAKYNEETERNAVSFSTFGIQGPQQDRRTPLNKTSEEEEEQGGGRRGGVVVVEDSDEEEIFNTQSPLNLSQLSPSPGALSDPDSTEYREATELNALILRHILDLPFLNQEEKQHIKTPELIKMSDAEFNECYGRPTTTTSQPPQHGGGRGRSKKKALSDDGSSEGWLRRRRQSGSAGGPPGDRKKGSTNKASELNSNLNLNSSKHQPHLSQPLPVNGNHSGYTDPQVKRMRSSSASSQQLPQKYHHHHQQQQSRVGFPAAKGETHRRDTSIPSAQSQQPFSAPTKPSAVTTTSQHQPNKSSTKAAPPSRASHKKTSSNDKKESLASKFFKHSSKSTNASAVGSHTKQNSAAGTSGRNESYGVPAQYSTRAGSVVGSTSTAISHVNQVSMVVSQASNYPSSQIQPSSSSSRQPHSSVTRLVFYNSTPSEYL